MFQVGLDHLNYDLPLHGQLQELHSSTKGTTNYIFCLLTSWIEHVIKNAYPFKLTGASIINMIMMGRAELVVIAAALTDNLTDMAPQIALSHSINQS